MNDFKQEPEDQVYVFKNLSRAPALSKMDWITLRAQGCPAGERLRGREGGPFKGPLGREMVWLGLGGYSAGGGKGHSREISEAKLQGVATDWEKRIKAKEEVGLGRHSVDTLN